MMHEEDERPQNENPHANNFCITYNGCEFCFCNGCSPQNVKLNDDVSLFVVSFA